MFSNIYRVFHNSTEIVMKGIEKISTILYTTEESGKQALKQIHNNPS